MGKSKSNRNNKKKYVPIEQLDNGSRYKSCPGETSRTTPSGAQIDNIRGNPCSGRSQYQSKEHGVGATGASYDDQRNDHNQRKGSSKVTYERSDHYYEGSKEQANVKKFTSQLPSLSEKPGSNRLNEKTVEMKCLECREKFTLNTRLPKSLVCGHTLCCLCLSKHLETDRCCPKCKIQFGDNHTLNSFCLNHSVIDIIIEANRTVTVGSGEPKENCEGGVMNRDCPPSERSPHDSRCLEVGIMPLYYCALCLKWVCEKCGNIDHSQQKCHLIPKKEALHQMTKAQRDEAETVRKDLESTLTDLRKYGESLDSFSLAMQAAFESIATEKKRVKEMEEQRLKKVKELNAVVEALPDAKNLSEALAALVDVEDQCRTTLDWQKKRICETLDEGKVVKITKEILSCTVLMKSYAENEGKAFGHVFAKHCISGVPFYSRLEAIGGRILVHALKSVDTMPLGSRAISLNGILHCLDKASSLTFLDIGLNGNMMDRVYVRLIGDTVRGRQFLALCMGKCGPSFHKTGFHRIWWKGLPAEHVWGGDYEKNNGSSRTSLLNFMEEEKEAIPQGLELPITPGLVAGRYEKSNVSSIFRIYTRGYESEGERGAYGSFPSTAEGGKDEAGFGYVEHGLNTIQNAVRCGRVQDITILNCGVVIETDTF